MILFSIKVLSYLAIDSQEEQNKVASLRQEIKDREEKLKQLKTDFKESCNIPENASFDEIINIVHDHIKRRSHLRLIQKNLMVNDIMNYPSYFIFLMDYISW